MKKLDTVAIANTSGLILSVRRCTVVSYKRK
nr:MAG TPA: hypothetical protein [Bacteriophage sp.]